MEKLNKVEKITKSTFKGFIKRNKNILLKIRSNFDAMTDCVEQLDGGFIKPKKAETNISHNLGILGLWLVNGGRDYFSKFEDEKFIGIEYYNSCGSGIIVVKKNK